MLEHSLGAGKRRSVRNSANAGQTACWRAAGFQSVIHPVELKGILDRRKYDWQEPSSLDTEMVAFPTEFAFVKAKCCSRCEYRGFFYTFRSQRSRKRSVQQTRE